MKKELGKGPLIGIAVVGALVLLYVAYTAFFASSGYSAEAQKQNDRQAEVSDANFDRIRNSIEPESGQPAAGGGEQGARASGQ